MDKGGSGDGATGRGGFGTGLVRPANPPQHQRKRVPVLERTLAILVQSMRGNKVVVELKNDFEISGLLEETDQNMNLKMVDVRQTSATGSVRKMDMVMIQGKMIRYVHIPDEVDAIQNLHRHMRLLEKNSSQYRRHALKAPDPSKPPDFSTSR